MNKGYGLLAAGAGLVGAFTLLQGPNTLRTADEIRGDHPSNFELFGQFVGDQPHVLHDLVSDPLSDGEFTEADGLLQDAEGKLLLSVLALGAVSTGVVVTRNRKIV